MINMKYYTELESEWIGARKIAMTSYTYRQYIALSGQAVQAVQVLTQYDLACR